MFSNPVRRVLAAGLVLGAAALVALGCGGDSGGGGPKIGFLLPENSTPRYEAADKPYFEDEVKKICSDCEILYQNSGEKVNEQQSQAESVLTQGADVLVVDPVDATSSAAIAAKAKAQNVPVISYDRLILNSPDVDYLVGFDNIKVGELQGSTLADALKANGKASGPVIQLNGDPADNNAKGFAQGATNAFKQAGVTVAKTYDTPAWDASKAQTEAQQALTALGKNGVAGVLAANDDLGGGAIAALKNAGLNPADVPVTGQDSTVAGVQRILAGQQLMTIYKAIQPEAKAAAQLAVALAKGDKPPAGLVNGKTNNLETEVPSITFDPVAVTKDNVKKEVIDSGFLKASEVCTAQYAAACKKAGIS